MMIIKVKLLIKKYPWLYKIMVALYKNYMEIQKRSGLIKKLRRGWKEDKLTISSIKEYCEKKGIERKVFEEKQEREAYIPMYYLTKTSAKIETYETPEIYYCKLSCASVLGAHDGIIIENYYLNDKMILPNYDKIVIDSPSITKINQEECLIFRKKGETIEEAISLVGCASENYYHFTFDILSKLCYINEFDDLKDIPIILDDTICTHNSYMELLQYVDRYRHPIITIGRNGECCVRKLHYFSPCTFGSVYGIQDSNIKYVKSRAPLDFFRRMIIPLINNISICSGKRIFLIRGKDKTKRLINEEEIATIFMRKGFELVDPGKYSLLEQAKIFHEAEVIVGAEGAAFVNILYCNKNAKIIYIDSSELLQCQFSTIAHTLGLKCFCLDTQLLGKGREQVMDIHYCNDFLRTLNF